MESEYTGQRLVVDISTLTVKTAKEIISVRNDTANNFRKIG